MALAKGIKGTSLLIKVSDGEATPAFTHPCIINAARSIEFQTEFGTARLPDCSNPELKAWLRRNAVSQSASAAGAGKLHGPDVEYYWGLWDAAEPIACRIELSTLLAADGGGYWAGNFVVSRFSVRGDVGDYADVDIAFDSDGEVNWVAAT